MRLFYYGAAVAVASGAAVLWFVFCTDRAEAPTVLLTEQVSVLAGVPDLRNLTFRIDGRPITLVNGLSVMSIVPSAESVLRTQYFGNEATGDLNADGVPDAAFLVSVDGGGSGIFFYVVAALSTSDGFIGTEAAFLGDRIAPQTTEIRDGVLLVNLADRAPGEAMAAVPTIGKTYRYHVDGVSLTLAGE